MSSVTSAQEQTTSSEKRGRSATRPGEIPARGWRDIAWRIWGALSRDNVSILSAGVGFYALLAIFPALAAIISLYGLVADPVDVQQQLNALGRLLPADAQSLLDQQLTKIAAGSKTALGLGVIAGLVATIWSASKGTKSLITALNIVYDEEEKRSFFKLNVAALLLTAGALVFVVVALGVIVALPVLFGNLGLPQEMRTWINLLRWPLLVVCVMVSLAVIYRYGPCRAKPRWEWVTWGAVIATLIWIAGSVLFSYYVTNFGNYNETYGSVGAVIILLMWFYVTAFCVLLGAEFNAKSEHQTRRDTTTGEPQPLGERGAFVADTVGAAVVGDDAEGHGRI